MPKTALSVKRLPCRELGIEIMWNPASITNNKREIPNPKQR
jgi:hypothetical protein